MPSRAIRNGSRGSGDFREARQFRRRIATVGIELERLAIGFLGLLGPACDFQEVPQLQEGVSPARLHLYRGEVAGFTVTQIADLLSSVTELDPDVSERRVAPKRSRVVKRGRGPVAPVTGFVAPRDHPADGPEQPQFSEQRKSHAYSEVASRCDIYRGVSVHARVEPRSQGVCL